MKARCDLVHPCRRHRGDAQFWANQMLDELDLIDKIAALGRSEDNIEDIVRTRALEESIIHLGHAVNEMDHAVDDTPLGPDLTNLIAMRGRLAHNYIETNPEIIWSTATKHLPKLRAALRDFLDSA